MSVYALRDATPACGGKAVGLARLIAAGLPVPDGFVLDDSAFRELAGPLDLADEEAIGHQLSEAHDRITRGELPAALVDEVEQRAAALTGAVPAGSDVPWRGPMFGPESPRGDRGEPVFVVRSSATIEDGTAGSAAGVFSSQQGVPFHSLWLAIRIVWQSALTPLAAAYARRRGGPIAIGVIVQRYIPGVHVTIYTRAPGEPTGDRALIQRGTEAVAVSRASDDPLLALALRAEAAIGATTGADVELAGDWLVQARPIVHPVREAPVPAPPSVTAALVADGRVWTFDIAHNPDPLSTAQAELVERVDRAGVAPYDLRVCAGYLYSAPRPDPPAPPPNATSVAVLGARAAALEARLAEAIDVAEVPPLAEAIARYVAFYAIWAGELGPLIAGARGGLTPEQLVGARPSAVEATLLAAARGEIDEVTAVERLGILAPAWDVAVPTYGERSDSLHTALRRARTITPPPPPADPGPPLARAAADLAERDDTWFARAQLLVRRAILARADELGIAREDAFWIPLDDLERGGLDPDDVHRRAAGARSAMARAAKWAMPRTVGGPPEPVRRALHGVGTGPRVTGRIVRFGSLASSVTVGSRDVVVTRAVTPALAVQVIGCAALVSETGGLLDHGAALARELGIPCVVGCHDAWTLLDGTVVTVDGDAGSVEIT